MKNNLLARESLKDFFNKWDPDGSLRGLARQNVALGIVAVDAREEEAHRSAAFAALPSSSLIDPDEVWGRPFKKDAA